MKQHKSVVLYFLIIAKVLVHNAEIDINDSFTYETNFRLISISQKSETEKWK